MIMSSSERWIKEREANSKMWQNRALEKAKEIGVDIKLPLELLHARSKAIVVCSHTTTSSPLYSFCSKVCCCRSGSNEARVLTKESRKKIGESNSLTWRKPDRFWANPENLSEYDKNRPDIFYVAKKSGYTKVGRVKPSFAKTWFKQWDEIIKTWNMRLEDSLYLEQFVRKRFNDSRPLDRSLGKGWTELFDVNHLEIINFIENHEQEESFILRPDTFGLKSPVRLYRLF
jgi:hypothetical protein